MKLKYSVTEWFTGTPTRCTVATFRDLDDAEDFAEKHFIWLTDSCALAGRVEIFAHGRSIRVWKIKDKAA